MTGFNLSEWALRHRSLVWFLIVAVVIAGIGSYMKLGRAEDPSFTIKTMVVQAQWPGATVGDTLDQITDRIEKQLQDTDYLDYLKSYTTAGSATIYVNLNDNARPEDVEGIWQQVRNDVNDMWYQMPQGVQGPFFNTKFGDTYGIVYAFTADGFSQRELRDYVEAVRSQLLGVKDVGKIDLFGTQDEKIYIEFDSRKLAQLNLNRQALIQALQTQNAVTPSGIVQTDGEKILVQVSGGFASEADIAKVNFNVDGKLIRLSDLATVTRGTADPPQPMFRYNGTPAIGLAISMAEGGNNLELGKGIAAAMARITNDLPVGIEPHLAANQPEVVSAAIDDFTEALWEAIAIVMAVSFLSLGLRAGAVVACSIPLVLAAVFIGMEFDNIDLQRISLGALIIALGLLVDDAMITVEMMVSRLEAGDDKHHSAVYAYTHTAFPMLTGTLVTVLGFVPIGFSKSSAGEYTFSLFAVVAMALLISWVVAVVAAPLIGTAILPATVKHKHAEGPGPIIRTFKHVLVLAMRLRWLVVAGALALLVLAGLGFKYIPNQFFPASDRPELLVDLNLKQGSSIYGTEKVAETFDEILKGDPDVDHWTTYVGRGAIRFYLALALQLGNDSYAQAVIVTKSIEARERLRKKLEPILAEKFPQVTPRLYALELGPPIGWPVQYRVTGPDIDKVRDVAYQVATLLDQSPHADKVTFDWIEPQRTLRLVINQDQAHQLGVSSQSIAQALNAVMSGMTVTQVRDGIYLIDVVGRAVESERISPDTLLTQSIPLPNGGTVPLVQLASIDYSYDFPIVWRRDRLPTLTVQADVAGGATAPTVVKELQPQIDKISASLPFGYHIEIGGTEEESAKSTASLAAGLPIAGFLILAVLMIQLQSLQLTFLVISVAPFGLIGVVASLLMFQKPLGFVAILGIIALVGMIIRNSVILVHQIELEREAGRDPWDAVVEAAAHRFRPILLTAAAATLGMLPIAPTVFWGPMAYAIIGGLIVATILTLIFLPALYVIWFRIREPKGGATASAPPPGATAPAALTAH
jgi:multidrug efflux pump subunit AcrB